jgi:hypothetical protein
MYVPTRAEGASVSPALVQQRCLFLERGDRLVNEVKHHPIHGALNHGLDRAFLGG